MLKEASRVSREEDRLKQEVTYEPPGLATVVCPCDRLLPLIGPTSLLLKESLTVKSHCTVPPRPCRALTVILRGSWLFCHQES